MECFRYKRTGARLWTASLGARPGKHQAFVNRAMPTADNTAWPTVWLTS